jgi:hypothetical protein
MTPQEVFDTAVNALRKQGSQSVARNADGSVKMVSWSSSTPVCLYRSADGKKCAAGHLIQDEEYSPEMEGKNITDVLFGDNVFSLTMKERLGPHQSLIYELQREHDQYSPTDWEQHFKYIAKEYNLVYTPKEET